MTHFRLSVETILNGIKDGFEQYTINLGAPRTVTRNWKDRAAYNNRDLESGHVTFVYTGENPNTLYDVYVKFLVIARIYCGANATGLEVEQAELVMLQQWRDFTSSSAFGDISIQTVLTSQQQEFPDGWFLAECRTGPYNLAADIDWLPIGPKAIPDEILVSQSPNIGSGHADHYFPMNEDL